MERDDIKKYLALMAEVKRRTLVIDTAINLDALGGNPFMVYKATSLESVYLQFRKILELIALGSLVANKKAFSQAYEKFAQFWNAKLLINDMERVNPGFWPQAITEEKSENPGDAIKWIDTAGCLTKDDLIKLYEKCGGILHADNPYGRKTDYSYYHENVLGWRNKIVKLLNKHIIRLVDSTDIYLIQMGAPDKNPTYHPFAMFRSDDPQLQGLLKERFQKGPLPEGK